MVFKINFRVSYNQLNQGIFVMAIATITITGQVTIPKEIRDYLGLCTGSKIDFIIDENGMVKIIPLDVPINKLSGILYRAEKNAATLEEMEQSIRDTLFDKRF
jgi:AbrB family looped-hinge helix DNA binding protein